MKTPSIPISDQRRVRLQSLIGTVWERLTSERVFIAVIIVLLTGVVVNRLYSSLPYSSLFGPRALWHDAADVDGIQLKLTYIGPQDRPIRSVILTDRHQAMDGMSFPIAASGASEYVNDFAVPAIRGFATKDELLSALQYLEQLDADILDGDPAPYRYLSFSAAASVQGQPQGFDEILDREQAVVLIPALYSSLQGSNDAQGKVSELAMILGLDVNVQQGPAPK